LPDDQIKGHQTGSSKHARQCRKASAVSSVVNVITTAAGVFCGGQRRKQHMTTLSVRVNRISQEACESSPFELVSTDKRTVASFTPGSHVDVLRFRADPQSRCCNGPDDTDRYLIAVKREVVSRGGSQAMHEHIQGRQCAQFGRKFGVPLNINCWAAKSRCDTPS